MAERKNDHWSRPSSIVRRSSYTHDIVRSVIYFCCCEIDVIDKRFSLPFDSRLSILSDDDNNNNDPRRLFWPNTIFFALLLFPSVLCSLFFPSPSPSCSALLFFFFFVFFLSLSVCRMHRVEMLNFIHSSIINQIIDILTQHQHHLVGTMSVCVREHAGNGFISSSLSHLLSYPSHFGHFISNEILRHNDEFFDISFPDENNYGTNARVLHRRHRLSVDTHSHQNTLANFRSFGHESSLFLFSFCSPNIRTHLSFFLCVLHGRRSTIHKVRLWRRWRWWPLVYRSDIVRMCVRASGGQRRH